MCGIKMQEIESSAKEENYKNYDQEDGGIRKEEKKERIKME